MTNERSGINNALRRCAVCKIDLKGRLVYIDDQIEALLGFTREELFGKLFLDYLDKRSGVVIGGLTDKRNNYETFYDSTRLGIRSCNGRIVSATAVVSLNFIAGNPVNFVIIIIPGEAGIVPEGHADDGAFTELLGQILESADPFDFETFLQQLKAASGAQIACLYLIHESSMELRHVAGEDVVAIPSAAVPKVTEVHHRVAESGRVYDYTNKDTWDGLGIEPGEAPPEYANRVEIDGCGCFLVRLIFGESLGEIEAAHGVSRCDLALRFLQRSKKPVEEKGDNTIDIRFAVGLLDGLGLGALLTDRDGKVAGHNPAMLRMLGEQDAIGDLRNFCRLIEGDLTDDSASPIRECFLNASDPRCNNRIALSLPDGTPASLIVLRLGDGLEDLSSLLAIVPQKTAVERVRVS